MLSESYSYLDGANGDTSYNVTSKAIKYGSSGSITYNYTYNLDNPALGDNKLERANPYNIWQIKEGSVVKVEYSYDLLGRLVRENNVYANATVTYAYDTNNNLIGKTIYGYTTGSDLKNGTTITYTYGNPNFKDRLTKYNGISFEYDYLGNIVKYGSTPLTWEGRELKSFGATTFSYDMNGMRSKKGETTYVYSGTQIVKESDSEKTITYLYGQSGLIGFELNGVSYYYIRNLLGDVTGIIDSTGKVVVQYSYDSWGKVLSATGSLASTVGTLNPIRYRGYYYDEETGLYYLQSRYYDPEIGRFISPDVVAEGGNLYAYCVNDPVNRSDESGYLSKTWKNIIKVAIGVVATVAAVAITVATGGAALPVIASVAVSTVIGAGISAGITALQGGSGEDILGAAIDGAIDGFMWGGISALASASISAIRAGATATKATANVSKGTGSGITKTTSNSTFTSRGSTGRTVPNNLNEKFGMMEAKSMPIEKWKVLKNVDMRDPRWLASDGWQKLEYSAGKYSKIIIHANYNVILEVFDDFKFKF